MSYRSHHREMVKKFSLSTLINTIQATFIVKYKEDTTDGIKGVSYMILPENESLDEFSGKEILIPSTWYNHGLRKF